MAPTVTLFKYGIGSLGTCTVTKRGWSYWNHGPVKKRRNKCQTEVKLLLNSCCERFHHILKEYWYAKTDGFVSPLHDCIRHKLTVVRGSTFASDPRLINDSELRAKQRRSILVCHVETKHLYNIPIVYWLHLCWVIFLFFFFSFYVNFVLFSQSFTSNWMLNALTTLLTCSKYYTIFWSCFCNHFTTKKIGLLSVAWRI